MAKKELRYEPTERVVQGTWDCSQVNAKATITAYYIGIRMCKTDLEKTYHLSGWNCSLLDEKLFSCCRETCPYKPTQYL